MVAPDPDHARDGSRDRRTERSGRNPSALPHEPMVPTRAEHRRCDRQGIPALDIPCRGVRRNLPLNLTGEGHESGARLTGRILVEDQQAPLLDVRMQRVLRVQFTVRCPGGVLAPVSVTEIEGTLSRSESVRAHQYSPRPPLRAGPLPSPARAYAEPV